MKKHGIMLVVLALLLSVVVPVPLFAAPAQSEVKSTLMTRQININSASTAELQLIPGIGQALAERIVQYRSEHGAFTSIDSLSAVRGIGEKSLAKMRPWVTLK